MFEQQEQLELQLTSSSELFSDLRISGKYNDVTLASNDGHMVRAHRIVLGASSGWFTRIFTELEQEQGRPVIYMMGANIEELNNLMELLYNGRVVMASQSVENIVKLVEELEIDGIRASRFLTRGEKSSRREHDTNSKKSTSQEDLQEESRKKNSANYNLDEVRKDNEKDVLKTEIITTDEENIVNNHSDSDTVVNLFAKEATELSMNRLHDTDSRMMSSNQSNEARKHCSVHMIGDLSEISAISIPAQGSEKSNSVPLPEVEGVCKMPLVDKEAKFMNSPFIKNEEKLEKKIACKWCGSAFTSSASIFSHTKTKHPEIKDNSCPVYGCNFQSRKVPITTHIRARHTKEAVFCCEVCQMKFSYKLAMVRHVKLGRCKSATNLHMKKLHRTT